MLKIKEEQISREKKELQKILQDENDRVGGFYNRYKELKAFRNALAKYVCAYSEDDISQIAPKVSILENGHVLDHHVMGYFAPMDFVRPGYIDEGQNRPVLRTPCEQLMGLSNYLKMHGIRMIYVPMPCKLAVYPELAVPNEVIPDDRMMIPQWRKLIWELSSAGMEVVDVYRSFKRCYNEVFSKNHHLSPVGCGIVAAEISEYINKTTEITQKELNSHKITVIREAVGSPVLSISGNYNSLELGMDIFHTNRVFMEYDGEKLPYVGCNEGAKIAIIGDCNLQSYRGYGCDITAQLTGKIAYPVKYLGRYLPFANIDTLDKLPAGTLKNVEILIYAGFISACFVRAYRNETAWSDKFMKESAF